MSQTLDFNSGHDIVAAATLLTMEPLPIDKAIINLDTKPSKIWSLGKLFLYLPSVFVLEIIFWSLINIWTGSLKEGAKEALISVKSTSSDRFKDSSDMLPPGISRVYQIQAKTLDKKDAILSAIRLVEEARKQNMQSLPDEIDLEIIRGILDLSYQDFYIKGEQQLSEIEQWLITSIGHSLESDYLVPDVYKTIEHNYFLPAQQSVSVGLIEDAKRLFNHYVLLVNLLSQGTTLISDDSEIQLKVAQAHVLMKILSGHHIFRTETLNDLLYANDESQIHLTDPDPGIKLLAIFTVASGMYQAEDYLECVAFLQYHRNNWGLLENEFEYLMAECYAEHGFSSLITMPDRGRDVLVDAEKKFEVLATKLPDQHYLKDNTYFWRAYIIHELGDTETAGKILIEALNRYPSSDLRSTMENKLTEYGVATDSDDSSKNPR